MTDSSSQRNVDPDARAAARPVTYWRVEGSLFEISALRSIAFFNWKFAVALYLGLAVVEWLLVRGGLIGLSTLPWLTDLVPAVILSLYAANKTSDFAI